MAPRHLKNGIVVATLLLIALTILVWAGTVTGATGGTAISADTAATGGTGAWPAITGPTYAETVNGDLNNGTVILTVTAGFEFNTGVAVSGVLLTGDSNVPENMNNVAVGGNVATTANASLTLTLTSTTSPFRCFLSLREIRLTPYNGRAYSYVLSVVFL